MSICIPSVRSPTLVAAVDSIRLQSRDDWELLVVMQGDDGDLRARVAALGAQDARIRGIWLPERGVSRARNAGAAAAAADVIAFIDDDCEASPDWLARMTRALVDDHSVGFVAGALLAPPVKTRWVATCPSSHPLDFTLRPSPGDQALPPGAAFVTANLAVRRGAWEQVGPFDEELGAGRSFRGGEDLDLLLRIVSACVPVRFLPTAAVRHTYGTRYGVRSALDVSTAYGSGQGAVAAKLTLAGRNGEAWLRSMRREILTTPLRRGSWHRIPPRLPRLIAFERSYRRCLRDYRLDDRGMLTPRS